VKPDRPRVRTLHIFTELYLKEAWQLIDSGFSPNLFHINLFYKVSFEITPDRFGILYLTQGRHHTHLLPTLYQVGSRDSFYLSNETYLIFIFVVVSICQRTLSILPCLVILIF